MVDEHNHNISAQLKSLNKAKNALMQCEDINTVVAKALAMVRNKLNTQAASIFLFTKDGLVKRIGIDGIDKYGQNIDNAWFAEEQYQPGDSFSAKAVPKSSVESGYGEPIFSNDLQNYPMNEHTKLPYLEKLGTLVHGISVPLSGRHRTFGTIEVINKLNSDKQVDTSGFSSEDIYWLMNISSSLSTIISACKREDELSTFKKLNEKIIEWNEFENRYDIQGIYNFIANSLVKDFSPYKVCILRRINDGYLEVMAISTSGISTEGRDDRKRKPEGILGEVYHSKNPKIITNISDKHLDYYNREWLIKNKLVSHACYPLIARDKCVGTISVFTRYEHKFYEDDKSFLQNISFLAALFINRVNLEDELKQTKTELRVERDIIVKAAYSGVDSSSTDYFVQELSHRYKNELMYFQELLEQIGETKDSKQRQQLIEQNKKNINSRIGEISQGFSHQQIEQFDLNKSVKRTVKLVRQEKVDDLNDIKIKFTEDYSDDIPLLTLNKIEIESVIYNLLINAVNAIAHSSNKNNGEIKISTGIIIDGKSKISTGVYENISSLQIVVNDNGVGIPKDLQEQIFERGFTTNELKGTGIGLFTAKKVIKNYDGTITVFSQVGQGTTFLITIPI